MFTIQTFISCACDMGPNIIAGTVVMLVTMFVAFPMLSSETLTVS